MIPVTKNHVYIREEPQGAVLVNTDNNKYVLVSSLEAFILSLCDGTRTVHDIAMYIQFLKNAPKEKEIINDIYTFIQTQNEHIEFIQSPLKKSKGQVDPVRFLLKPVSLYERPKQLQRPIAIDLYLTKKCNLNCVYCFANAEYVCPQKENSQGDEMSLDTINNIIDQMAELGIKKTILTGGEVTLRKDLIAIIRRLRNYGIDIVLPTNACSINDELAKELKELGIEKIQTKLDAATPETQDKLSRVKGSYLNLINGIKTLKKYSFEISTVAVATSWNIHEIPEVIKVCADLGIEEVHPRIYTPGIWALNGRGGAYLNPSPDSIIWLEKQIEKLQGEYGDNMRISAIGLDGFSKWKDGNVFSCAGGISSCTILHNGLVVPCEMVSDFRKDFIIGDAKKTSLYDIWNSEGTTNWVCRKDNIVSEPCLSCTELEPCKGGCPWKAIVSYGKWTCDPYCIKAPDYTHIPFPTI